jgi:hypothetical protein
MDLLPLLRPGKREEKAKDTKISLLLSYWKP